METYEDVTFGEHGLSGVVDRNNDGFLELKRKKPITENVYQCFTYKFNKPSILGKFYLFHKIHKRLFNAPSRTVISNCGTPTEKASEFLYRHLYPILKTGEYYVKDTNDFLEKLKKLGKISKKEFWS